MSEGKKMKQKFTDFSEELKQKLKKGTPSSEWNVLDESRRLFNDRIKTKFRDDMTMKSPEKVKLSHGLELGEFAAVLNEMLTSVFEVFSAEFMQNVGV